MMIAPSMAAIEFLPPRPDLKDYHNFSGLAVTTKDITMTQGFASLVYARFAFLKSMLIFL
jgi:hypothetical protein